MKGYYCTWRGWAIPFAYDEENQAGYIRTPLAHVGFGAATVAEAAKKAELIWANASE